LKMADKSVFVISKTLAFTFAFIVVALFLTEGLLIGLVGRPDCSTNVPQTSEAPPVQTTKPSVETTKPPDETTTPAQNNLWDNNRLPDSLKPKSYEVDLRPVFVMEQDTYWFYGSSSVIFTCTKPTQFLLLHTRDLVYDEDFLITKVSDGSSFGIKSTLFYTKNYYLVIEFNSVCEANEDYQFSAPSFKGELGTDLDGLYRSEYVNEDGKPIVIAVSQMETDGARQTFPCFDEPAFKAEFNIKLRHTEDYKAVSNMPITTQEKYKESDGSDWIKTTFGVTPIMSSYLLALTVTDFKSVNGSTVKGVQTGIYGRSVLVDNGDLDFASEISPQLIDVYDVHFNVFYPLVKSDQMCVPDFGAGAMENWGLVIYREYYLIYDAIMSSPSNKYSVTSVIAHELAHQWFGNLVTCSFWNEIWLNEGFATYVSYIGTDGVRPNWASWELFITDDLQLALSADSYSNSHPLVHPQGYFSTISYSKGGSFLRMVNDFLGEDTFTKGLTNYLNEFSYNVASHDDLFNAWIEQAKEDGITFPVDLQKVFESWSLQMGYPIITVKKENSKITMSQEYFLVDPTDSPRETEHSHLYNYKWYVPITYKLGSEIASSTHQTVWMELDDDVSVDLVADDFLLVNVDAVGFYRVQYEGTLWEDIKQAVKANPSSFSPQNRAQFIDDVFALSKSERVDVEEVLDLSLYLKDEHDYIPWYTFYSGIDYYDKMLSGSEIYGDFSNYMLELSLDSMYKYYGWDESDVSDDAFIERLSRGVGVDVACFYQDTDCIETAQQLYSQWMENTTNLVSGTYRSDVYCAAIRSGGIKEWDFAWDQYLASDSAQHQTSLRFGMSCSNDPWIINRYLERTLNTQFIRLQDSSSTLSYIGRHENSKYVAWAFAVNNWDRMNDIVGSSATSSLLSAAVGRFSTKYDLQLVESLRDIAASNWEGTINSYKSSIETNMRWREMNEEKIARWLAPAKQYSVDKSMFKITNSTPRNKLETQKNTPFPKRRMFEKPQFLHNLV